MKPRRILVLVHGQLVPPTDARLEDAATAPWKTEFHVVHTLKKAGHEVRVLGVISDVGAIRAAIEDFDPHIAFNLLEEFDGEAVFDQNVVSYLELKRLPYTGCSPRGLMIARDKALTKEILGFHRIGVPPFHVFRKNRRIAFKKNLRFPLIVKSLTEEASLGISQASIVRDEEKLRDRIQFIHDSIGTDAIAEGYIEGREFYLSILGNEKLTVFPVWELVFGKSSDHLDPIATSKVKFNPEFRKKYEISSQPAELTSEQKDALVHWGKKVYRHLGLTGYARIDLRMDARGKFYLIEANPNPDISMDEDFAESAAKSGFSYRKLLNKIVLAGLSRRFPT